MGLDWCFLNGENSIRVGSYSGVHSLRAAILKAVIASCKARPKKKQKTETPEIDVSYLQSWLNTGQHNQELQGKDAILSMLTRLLPIDVQNVPQIESQLPEFFFYHNLVGLWKFIMHSDAEGFYTFGDLIDVQAVFHRALPFVNDKEEKEWVEEISNFIDSAVEARTGIEFC